jgi:hypothetical protein
MRQRGKWHDFTILIKNRYYDNFLYSIDCAVVFCGEVSYRRSKKEKPGQ